MKNHQVIKKAICANSGLPVPDADYFEMRRSGEDMTGNLPCECPECYNIRVASEKKVRI